MYTALSCTKIYLIGQIILAHIILTIEYPLAYRTEYPLVDKLNWGKNTGIHYPPGFYSVHVTLASSPGRQLKFKRKDGLVPIATMLVRMRWPLREKHVIVYLACRLFRKLTNIRSSS